MSVNKAGSVSFHAKLDSGDEGVLRLDSPGTLLTIANAYNSIFWCFNSSTAKLAENGPVAFLGSVGCSGSTSFGIYTGNGGVAELRRSS